jgi:hypothetical protein
MDQSTNDALKERYWFSDKGHSLVRIGQAHEQSKVKSAKQPLQLQSGH